MHGAPDNRVGFGHAGLEIVRWGLELLIQVAEVDAYWT